ncbi:AMP-binding protein, partial [Corallococcus caeni]|uniref:AMP-binding protein n=1 Tax=Corallococcus caeni TaxID=3082388 RepID=UPI0030C6E52D
ALMLEDSRAGLVLSHSALRDRLPPGAHRALCLDEVADEVASRPSSPPPLRLFPDNLAYLIYTSGSTGRPKAVAISHRSAAAMLFWARDCFSPEERSGVLASTSVCFDLSV